MDQRIPAYAAARYKILQSHIEGNDLFVLYVNELNEKDVSDIQYLVEKELKFSAQISEEEFNENYVRVYASEDKPVPADENADAEIFKGGHEVADDVAETFNPDIDKAVVDDLTKTSLKSFSLEDLEAEVRRRYTQKVATAQITVSSDGVSFAMNDMPWPHGKYNVEINVTKDVTGEVE